MPSPSFGSGVLRLGPATKLLNTPNPKGHGMSLLQEGFTRKLPSFPEGFFGRVTGAGLFVYIRVPRK